MIAFGGHTFSQQNGSVVVTRNNRAFLNISHILREYVENSVYIKSLEMTTEEISRNRDSFPFNKEEINRWLDILNRADLSKYAKSNPEKNICDDDLNAGKEFVINTASSWKVLND